ncbi:hypothetical protein RAB80_000926 [Fusarium oxysporum f. sp. vasinfectum]|nr:hypothetical protein RAB80_000926 [Fusarium oxysporum f. sp. vasinfectum]
MARPRDSRSPSPAGSTHSSRRHRNDDRRARDRRNDGRDHRRRSRSRSPDVRRQPPNYGRFYSDDLIHEQPRNRDRERDRDHGRDRDYYRRRDRSIDRRDDNYYRGGRRDHRERDRRRSRERYDDRNRSPDRRHNRSREGDRDVRRRDDSRNRTPGRREGTADSLTRSIREDGRTQKISLGDSGNPDTEEKPKADSGQPEVNKKAERLAKLEAWKKKKENASQKQKEVNPSQTRNLLAEMDKKASGASSKTVSPSVSATASPAATPTVASPVVPYSGKFDPKAIAKKSAASRTHEGHRLSLRIEQKLLDLDEEDTTKRKLTKLPALPIEADDTPYADQDDDESDGDNFAETEEEAAAAARAAHERRLQAENQMDTGEEESKTTEIQINGDTMSNNNAAQPDITTQMEVDEEEDDVDPLDAFMADLRQTDVKQPARTSKAQKIQEPEAYFSDDEYDFNKKDTGDANALLAMTAKRKKKDIPAIDYSKIEIEPIRKNFWVEPAELSLLTEAEVADLRLELDGIKVNGKDVPKPVQKWAQCGLTRQTLDVIDNLGFEKPTPIQMQALPALMSGRDVIGVAKTGSGKTMAFLLPMFRHIKDQPPLKDTDGPIGLIMTPTRELAVQIHRDCKPFLKMMGLRSVCAYGGAPIRDQIAELKRGAEIIVCTPGRMIDLLAANQGRVTNLKRVTYVVLDEADRMFDMGFEPQVMKIFANMRPDRQTILFSATMPRIIDSLTKKVLKNPIEVTVGGRSVVAKEIDQIVEVRDEPSKFLRVLELLGELYDRDEDARTLIFVERQEKADDLLKELMIKGYPCMSIHGGKDQIDRDSTISDFKKGVVPILIATSVAARGLDVKQLKLVINYDAPNHLEDYVHRAGRTGRAGNTGVAVTFVTPEQENCSVGIAKALEQSGQPVPERLDEMRKAHREKVKSGKAKDTSGFGGKGLDRLDQEQKALSAIRAAASGVQARESAKAEGAEVKPTQQANITGGVKDKSKDPLDKVSSAVSAINSRLGKAGQLRAGQPIDNKGPDAGAFHATLEINDFPQKARWAVTNRTNVAKILEATGTSITTKGNFYPPGKEVPAGAEPKLYILIEGDTEVVVGSALSELTRLLREGTIAAADADSRAPASGRYTIT